MAAVTSSGQMFSRLAIAKITWDIPSWLPSVVGRKVVISTGMLKAILSQKSTKIPPLELQESERKKYGESRKRRKMLWREHSDYQWLHGTIQIWRNSEQDARLETLWQTLQWTKMPGCPGALDTGDLQGCRLQMRGSPPPNAWLELFPNKTKNSSMLLRSTNAAMVIANVAAEAEADADIEIATTGTAITSERGMDTTAAVSAIPDLLEEKDLDVRGRDRVHQTVIEITSVRNGEPEVTPHLMVTTKAIGQTERDQSNDIVRFLTEPLVRKTRPLALCQNMWLSEIICLRDISSSLPR